MSIPTWVWVLLAVVAIFLVVRAFGSGGGAGAEGPKWVADGAALVDVRTVAEFEQGHVEGARNIPVQELEARWTELDPNQAVVVYCQAGGRAGRAKAFLEGKGFARVLNAGGIGDWPKP